MTDHVTLSFDRDEALVLQALFSRVEEEPAIFIRHDAERLTLMRLGEALRKAMMEPTLPDYEEILGSARDRLNVEWALSKAKRSPLVP